MSMESGRSALHRVVVVVPVLARHDAVGQAAVDTWRLLNEMPGVEAKILTNFSDRPEIPAEIIGGLPELLLAPTFLAADLIIYHFALHNPLFDALLVGNGHARQVVRFHNVTPAAGGREADRTLHAAALEFPARRCDLGG
jgi:hypothetical protein